jgi:hypothetical protein
VAPRVVNLLILGQGIGDQREQTNIIAERRSNSLAGGLAHGPVAVGQLVQRGADRQVLAVQLDPHGGDGFVEQPRPGGTRGQVAFMRQLFQVVAELMRPENPQIAQPRPVAGQRRIGQLGFQHRVVHPVHLQREEDQVAADRGHPLIDRLVEAADRGIGGIAREQKLCIRSDAPEQFLDTLIFGDHRGQSGTRQTCQGARMRLRKSLRPLFRPIEVGLEFRAIGGRVKIGQVPGRKGLRFGGGCIVHGGFRVPGLLHRPDM